MLELFREIKQLLDDATASGWSWKDIAAVVIVIVIEFTGKR